MRRWVRSGLAVVIGFLATAAMIAALETQRSSDEEPEPVLLGGTNAFIYCRETYGTASSAVLVGDDAWSWRCVFTSNDVFQEASIDFDAACRSQHADADAYAAAWDSSNPYSWECFVDR